MMENLLLLYIDDMLIISRNTSIIDRLKMEFSKSFAMKDLRSTKEIIGMNSVCDWCSP